MRAPKYGSKSTAQAIDGFNQYEKFFIELYYDTEILSSNIDFAVLLVYSDYFFAFYFIFYLILEKIYSVQHVFCIINKIDHARSNKLLISLICDNLTKSEIEKFEMHDID